MVAQLHGGKVGFFEGRGLPVWEAFSMGPSHCTPLIAPLGLYQPRGARGECVHDGPRNPVRVLGLTVFKASH